MVAAARFLGPEDFGKYAAGMALVTILEPLTDLGMREYFAKEVARNRGSAAQLFANMVSLRIALLVVTAGVLVAVFYALGYAGDMMLVTGILALAMVLRSFKFGVRAFFRAFGRYGYEAALLLLERTVTLVVAIAVLLSGKGLVLFVLVFPAVRLLDLLGTLVVFGSKISRVSAGADWQVCRNILRGSLPFGLMFATGVMYSRV